MNVAKDKVGERDMEEEQAELERMLMRNREQQRRRKQLQQRLEEREMNALRRLEEEKEAGMSRSRGSPSRDSRSRRSPHSASDKSRRQPWSAEGSSKRSEMVGDDITVVQDSEEEEHSTYRRREGGCGSGAEDEDKDGTRPEDTRGDASVDEKEAEEEVEEEMVTWLREMCGTQALEDVQVATLTLDPTRWSVDALGFHLPHLTKLRLEDSSLNSLRDLGTQLKNLRILWAIRCGLRDLDGVTSFPLLEELYVSFNSIDDCTSLALHDHLQVLDLEGNDIDDRFQIQQLGTCTALQYLVLEGNPVEKTKHLRRFVAHNIPSLLSLDDRPIAGADQQTLDGDEDEDEDEADDGADGESEAHGTEAIPGTAWSDEYRRGLSSSEDGSPDAGHRGGRGGRKHGRSWNRADTAQPGNPFAGASASASYESAASRLTHGSDILFAGNPAKDLRRWRAQQRSAAAGGGASSTNTFHDENSTS